MDTAMAAAPAEGYSVACPAAGIAGELVSSPACSEDACACAAPGRTVLPGPSGASLHVVEHSCEMSQSVNSTRLHRTYRTHPYEASICKREQPITWDGAVF